MTKCVVIGCGRCGTHWLIEMMGQAGLKIMKDEIVHPLCHIHMDTLSENYMMIELNFDVREYYHEKIAEGEDPYNVPLPQEIIDGLRCCDFFFHVYNEYDVCKILDYQWELIGNEERDWFSDNCKIIHITRNDIVAQYVSNLQAFATGSWYQTDKNGVQPKTMEIDVKDMHDSFSKFRSREAKVDWYYKDKFEITYEELLCDKQYHMDRLFEYIGVDSVEIEDTTVQKNTLISPVHFITNYAQIKQDYSNTKLYSKFQHQ